MVLEGDEDEIVVDQRHDDGNGAERLPSLSSRGRGGGNVSGVDSVEVDTARSEKGVGWMPSTIRVPQDCETVPEAIKRAVHGQTIHVQRGEHQWEGRIDVDKVVHIQGEKDEATGIPATALIGRWKLCVPPPKKWDLLPDVTGTFKDVRCETSGGYCVQSTGLHWEMTNARFFCKGGSALVVQGGTIVLDGCWVGGSTDKRIANNGVVICNDSRVFLNRTAVRNCKNGLYLREYGALFAVDSEIHRVSIAFGCMLPNNCEMEVQKTRLHEVENIWNENSRPEKLLQTGNYDVYGAALYLHGDCDGSQTFQTQDLMSTTR